MSKNLTIRLDEAVLRKCRHAAVEEDKSLSRWVADELVKVVSAQEVRQTAKTRALKRLEEGFSLGGIPLTRDDIYAG